MYKLLILGALVLTSSLFAQSRTNLRTFNCQMSVYSCNDYSDRQNRDIRAYNYIMAERKCESLSSRRGMRYCGVSRSNTGSTARFTEYRCQLATDFCGYNGGRYGVWIKSMSRGQAQNQCYREARNRGDRFCQINDQRTTQVNQMKQFTCLISHVRGCARPAASIINARSAREARNKCQRRADNRNRRLCRVIRR